MANINLWKWNPNDNYGGVYAGRTYFTNKSASATVNIVPAYMKANALDTDLAINDPVKKGAIALRNISINISINKSTMTASEQALVTNQSYSSGLNGGLKIVDLFNYFIKSPVVPTIAMDFSGHSRWEAYGSSGKRMDVLGDTTYYTPVVKASVGDLNSWYGSSAEYFEIPIPYKVSAGVLNTSKLKSDVNKLNPGGNASALSSFNSGLEYPQSFKSDYQTVTIMGNLTESTQFSVNLSNISTFDPKQNANIGGGYFGISFGIGYHISNSDKIKDTGVFYYTGGDVSNGYYMQYTKDIFTDYFVSYLIPIVFYRYPSINGKNFSSLYNAHGDILSESIFKTKYNSLNTKEITRNFKSNITLTLPSDIKEYEPSGYVTQAPKTNATANECSNTLYVKGEADTSTAGNVVAIIAYRTETSLNSNTWSAWKYATRYNYPVNQLKNQTVTNAKATVTLSQLGLKSTDNNKRVQLGVLFIQSERIKGVSNEDIITYFVGAGDNALLQTKYTNVVFYTHSNLIFKRIDYKPPTPEITDPSNNLTKYITSTTYKIKPVIKIDDEYTANQFNADYKEMSDLYKIQYSYDNSTWLNATLDKTYMVTPTIYEYQMNDARDDFLYDKDGNPILKLDANGNPIVKKPAEYDWRWVGVEKTETAYDEASYTPVSDTNPPMKKIYTRAVLTDDASKVQAGRAVHNYRYIKAQIINPIIQIAKMNPNNYTYTAFANIVEGESWYSDVKVKPKSNSRIINVVMYVEFMAEGSNKYGERNIVSITDEGYNTSMLGTYRVSVQGKMNTSGIEVKATNTYKIVDAEPPEAEIYGVSDNEIKTSPYDIYIAKKTGNTIDIYISKDGGAYTKVTTTSKTYRGKDCYNFKVDKEGQYSIKVVTTNNLSKLSREDYVFDFTYTVETVGSNLVEFYPPTGPVHSTIGIIHSGSPKKNKVTYTLGDFLKSKKYSSPLLVLDNYKLTGRDTTPAGAYKEENKTFNGVTTYLPELPNILGVLPDQEYNTPITISFKNLASKPTEASYLIFFDGKLLENPFSTPIKDFYNDGYHFITMISYNNIRPRNYRMSSMKFLIRRQDEYTIRRPQLMVSMSTDNQDVDITVKYSDLMKDYVHSLRIIYADDNSKEEWEYPYNIGTVKKKITRNCIVTATTKLPQMNISLSVSETINNIFDHEPIVDDMIINGVHEFPIIDENGNQVNVEMGNYAIININKQLNTHYEIYLNGIKYALGTLITNQEPEIRKYCLDVWAINDFYPEKISYVHREFYIDSIAPAFPMLMNHDPFIMNREALNQPLVLKKEGVHNAEGTLLNNRIINIATYVIPKDDEYILTVTYTYYNGLKRTSSFYFSINSNPRRDLGEHRAILKAQDYKNAIYEDEETKREMDGEFIVDRVTGHLWYNKEGVITPFTKNVEDTLLKVEEQLAMIEKEHLIFLHLYDYIHDDLTYLIDKATQFLEVCNKNWEKLVNISIALDTIISWIPTLQKNFDDYIEDCKKHISTIDNTYKKQLLELITKSSKLNTDFETLVQVTLPETYQKAATITSIEFNDLPVSISKKITLSAYNQWVQSEANKFSKFIRHFNSALRCTCPHNANGILAYKRTKGTAPYNKTPNI